MSDKTSPPPRPPISALRQTLRFMNDPFSFLNECRRELGDVFSLKIFGLGEWVFLCSIETANEMYRAPDDHLSAGEFNYRFLAFLLGPTSTVALDGPAHRARRKLLSPFLNGKGATQRAESIRQIIDKTIDSWPIGEPFPLMSHAGRVSLENLYRMIVGNLDQETVDRLVRQTDLFVERALKSPLMRMPPLQIDLGSFSPWGKIMKVRRKLRDILLEEVEKQRQLSREPGESIISALLAFEHEGHRLGNEEIVDEIITLVNAGQETSSRILTWTVAGILSTPGVQEQLRQELEDVLGMDPIAEEHLGELTYLDAVIQEGIRYKPFSPFIGGRVTKKPFSIGGYLMPQGSIVVNCFSETSQREDLFPHPDGFNPNNFLEGHLKTSEWTPFGGGARLCLGRGVGLVQLKVFLATLFQRAELELCQKKVESVPAGFLFVPENGLPVRLLSRR